jgi:hypothetical protein
MLSGRFESAFGEPRRALSELSPRSTDRSETWLSRRIEELDAEPPFGSQWPHDVTSAAERHAAVRLGHFARIMSWSPDAIKIEVGPYATITPGMADALARRSRMLAEIEQFDPSLIDGPMHRALQHWTPGRESAWTGEPPSEGRFITPQVGQPAAVKPFHLGLYTSTATAAGASMRRAYLGPGGSAWYPLPRYTWQLEINEDVDRRRVRCHTRHAASHCGSAGVSLRDIAGPYPACFLGRRDDLLAEMVFFQRASCGDCG